MDATNLEKTMIVLTRRKRPLWLQTFGFMKVRTNWMEKGKNSYEEGRTPCKKLSNYRTELQKQKGPELVTLSCAKAEAKREYK